MENSSISVISGKDIYKTEENDHITNEGKAKESNKGHVTPNVSGLLYTVSEIPPFGVIILSAIQIIFYSLGGVLSTSFLIYLAVCPGDHNDVLVTLISTSLFFVGLTTFLQVTFGLRLPILQGSSQSFLIPILLMMESSRWRCPTPPGGDGGNDTFVNGSVTDDPSEFEPWKPRLAEVSGSLALASCVHIVLGATGLIGVIVRFIGPLTVTPLLSLIALSLARVVGITSKSQWGIAILAAFLTIIFNIGLAKILMPCLSWDRKRGFHLVKIQVFRVFASIFAICICWILCLILTLTNAFPDNPKSASYKARTDVKFDALMEAPWIFFPYPGQWGPITLSIQTAIGMLGAIIASILESLGDYRVTAFCCRVPPPPSHAMNRAVMFEGIGSVLSGLFGACHATTSYSQFAGYISYSGVASRITFQVAAVIYMVSGIIGKVGGVLALIPDPVAGGLQIITSGMVLSAALAALKNVNLERPRNLMVLGVSIMIGASVPLYIQETPEALERDNTGILEVLLTNSPLLGGITGFILDNILPGSRKDRGFVETPSAGETEKHMENGTLSCNEETKGKKTEGLEVYEFNFPCCKNVSWPGFLRYVPFSPLYRSGIFSNFCKKCKRSKPASTRL